MEEVKTRKKYPKLETLDQIPEAKSQLTFNWMVAYVSEKGTEKQREQILKVIEEHQVERATKFKNRKNKNYESTDMKILRKEFCDMFFPSLNEKSNVSSKSQLDRAREMLLKKT